MPVNGAGGKGAADGFPIATAVISANAICALLAGFEYGWKDVSTTGRATSIIARCKNPLAAYPFPGGTVALDILGRDKRVEAVHGIGKAVFALPVPTVNPKQLSIACESVDGRSPSS
jgi:hypothetical protein